jgi:hypothetical protein
MSWIIIGDEVYPEARSASDAQRSLNFKSPAKRCRK